MNNFQSGQPVTINDADGNVIAAGRIGTIGSITYTNSGYIIPIDLDVDMEDQS